jgi:hypothetical protein
MKRTVHLLSYNVGSLEINIHPDVAFLQLSEQLHWTEQVETTGFEARQCISAPRFQASVRFNL